MKPPQTTREALIAELIGDIDSLFNRMEKLDKSILNAGNNVSLELERAGTIASDKLYETGTRIKRELASDISTLVKPIEAIVREAEIAAETVKHSANSFWSVAFFLGVVGGLIGGICSYFIISN